MAVGYKHSVMNFIRNFDFMNQYDDHSCGRICAYMVTAAFGVRQQRKYLRQLLKTDFNMGTYQKDLVLALRRFGFMCSVKTLATNDESQATVKRWLKHYFDKGYIAVASVDKGEHWIVVRGLKNDRVYVADPDPYGVKYHSLATFYSRIRLGSLVFVKRRPLPILNK